MIKQIFFMLALPLVLIACDHEDVTGQNEVRVTTASPPPPGDNANPASDKPDAPDEVLSSSQKPALDLKVTPEMMKEVLDKDTGTDNLATAVEPNPFAPRNKKTESRVNVKGEVYFDETRPDYSLDAIQGGKIDVEVKFRE